MSAARLPADTMVSFCISRALRPLFLRDQRLPIGNRNLVVIRVNFTEGQKAVAITAVVHKGGLQRRLYASDFGQIDIAAQLLTASGFKVEFLHSLTTQNDNPSLLRMSRVDEHLVGH